MPSVSPKQRKFMAAAANSPEFRKKVGISKDVATEFHNADRKKARFQEGGAVRDRQRSSEGRTIIREPGREPRVYDPYEDLRRKYQTPGTVIRGDELPNSRPTSRPNMEEGRVKRMAKGGKVGCGHGMKSGGKIKRYVEGGKVDDREVIDFTGEELEAIKRKGGREADRVFSGFRRAPLDYGVDSDLRAAQAIGQSYAASKAGQMQRRKGKSESAARDAEEVMKGQRYAAGGQVCRGMGAAMRGGKYKS